LYALFPFSAKVDLKNGSGGGAKVQKLRLHVQCGGWNFQAQKKAVA